MNNSKIIYLYLFILQQGSVIVLSNPSHQERGEFPGGKCYPDDARTRDDYDDKDSVSQANEDLFPRATNRGSDKMYTDTIPHHLMKFVPVRVVIGMFYAWEISSMQGNL